MIQFFIPMIPPNKTHQEKGERVVNGRIVHYTKDEVKAIRQLFLAELADHAPAAPFTGPVRLVTKWMYPAGYGYKHGQWKKTKPDTDNLIKLFKDCMTDVGFFKAGKNGYSADVIVGIRKNGTAVLYDLVGINEKIMTETPKGNASNENLVSQVGVSVKETIPHRPPKVKTNLRTNQKNTQ